MSSIKVIAGEALSAVDRLGIVAGAVAALPEGAKWVLREPSAMAGARSAVFGNPNGCRGPVRFRDK